jgi:hypothetical protein
VFDSVRPIVTTGILRIPYTHLVLECHRQAGSPVAPQREWDSSSADSVEKEAP